MASLSDAFKMGIANLTSSSLSRVALGQGIFITSREIRLTQHISVYLLWLILLGKLWDSEFGGFSAFILQVFSDSFFLLFLEMQSYEC